MTAEQDILVSVVIPTFNRLENLQRTVAGVEALDFDHSSVEILVIDNSSTDGTQEWAESRQESGFRYIRKKPEGPAVARNRGLDEARGDFSLLLDSDVELASDWLTIAMAEIQYDSTIGCVGGKILYSHRPDRVNAFGGVLSPLGMAWDAHERDTEASLNETEQCLWMNCSAMLIRTELARDIKKFDPVFFIAYEDTDFGWRVNLAGYSCIVLPTLKAFHHVGMKILLGNEDFTFEYNKNRLRMLLKNYALYNLMWVLPIYLIFTVADVALRIHKKAKVRAILWNIVRLGDTLSQRRSVQRQRVARDSELKHLFSKRWFPEVRLEGRRRRPADAESRADAATQNQPDFWT